MIPCASGESRCISPIGIYGILSSQIIIHACHSNNHLSQCGKRGSPLSLYTTLFIKQAYTFLSSFFLYSQKEVVCPACFCVVICKPVSQNTLEKIHVINFLLEVQQVALSLGDFLTCSSIEYFVASWWTLVPGRHSHLLGPPSSLLKPWSCHQSSLWSSNERNNLQMES